MLENSSICCKTGKNVYLYCVRSRTDVLQNTCCSRPIQLLWEADTDILNTNYASKAETKTSLHVLCVSLRFDGIINHIKRTAGTPAEESEIIVGCWGISRKAEFNAFKMFKGLKAMVKRLESPCRCCCPPHISPHYWCNNAWYVKADVVQQCRVPKRDSDFVFFSTVWKGECVRAY